MVFPVETSCDNVTFYNQTVARPSVQVFWYNKYQSKASKTIYQYTPVLRMVRVKIWNTQEKFFFPEMLNSENQWVTTRGTTIDFPFYNSMLLPQSDLTLLVTEGEKCAAQLSQDFALTVSPVGFGSNSEKYLRRHIGNLKYSVKNVLYVPDNDAPGKHKADLFQRICWENHLPCSVLRLDYGGDDKDIFDWLTTVPRSKPEIQLFLLGGLRGI